MSPRRQSVIDQRGYIFLFPSLGLPNLNPKGEFHLIRVAIGTEAQAKRLLYDNKVEATRRYARDGYALFDLQYEGAVWIMPLVAAEQNPSQTEVFTLLVQRIHPNIVPDPGRRKVPNGRALFTLFHPEGFANFQPPLPPKLAKITPNTSSRPTEADEKAFWDDEENILGVMTSEKVPKTLDPNTEIMEASAGSVYMKSRAGRRQRNRADEQEKKAAEPPKKTHGYVKMEQNHPKKADELLQNVYVMEQNHPNKAGEPLEKKHVYVKMYQNQPKKANEPLCFPMSEQDKRVGEQLMRKIRQDRKEKEEGHQEKDEGLQKGEGHVKETKTAEQPPVPLTDWPCPPKDAFDEVWQLEARTQAIKLALYIPGGFSGPPTLGITLRARTSEDEVRFKYAVTYGSEPAQEWQWLPLPKRAWKPGCELRFTNQVRKGMGLKLITQEELVGA